jgi:hypothetical protein
MLVVAGENWAANHAAVLLYHNVSYPTPDLTTVSPGQFEQHFNYL